MTSKTDIIKRIEDFATGCQEDPSLTDVRIQALKQMDDLAFPHIERSKYQHHVDLQAKNFDQESAAEAPTFQKEDDDQPYLSLFDNRILEAYLPQSFKDQGVIFTSMQEAMDQHADLLRDYYMTQVLPWDADKMAAHHAAFMNGGAFLYIPDQVQLEDAFQLNIIQDASLEKAFNPHILIVLGHNARCTFVEKMETAGDQASTANIVVEILAQTNAQLHYSSIDQLAETTTAFIRRHALCHEGAVVDWAIGAMNNGNVVLDAYTELRGRGASSDLKIVSITHGKQQQVINSHVLNIGQQTVGNIFQHGAILDQSRLTFNAIGKIEKGAKNADAQQESRLLMFSQGARGDANPILLIDEFEVMAGHAASVGQIDREQLYYLMSRGISEQTAMRLAIRGFLGPVIQAIPLPGVRQDLIDNIERKLETL